MRGRRAQYGEYGPGEPHAASGVRPPRSPAPPGGSDGRPGARVSYKSCPDWPALMELAPDLQFKHMTVREAHLPFEVVASNPGSL